MNYEHGIWVGIDPETSESILITPGGRRTSPSIRRLIPEERFDRSFLERCTGLPWDPKGRDDDETNQAREEAQEQPHSEPLDVPMPRRDKLRKSDFATFGYSEGCPGCKWLQAKVKRGNQPNHSETCRTRMVEALKTTEAGRARLRKEADKCAEYGERLQRGAAVDTSPGGHPVQE